MIKFRCQQCNKKIGVPDDYAGKSVRCPQCHTVVNVPQPQATETPAMESQPYGEISGGRLMDALGDLESATPTNEAYHVAEEEKCCPACGKQLSAKARKCNRCGERLEPTATVATAQTTHQVFHRPTAKSSRSDIWYAGFWRRTLAYVIDNVAFYIMLYGISRGIGFILKKMVESGALSADSIRDNAQMLTWIFMAFPVIIFWLYYAISESGTHQATIGKRLLGLYVTDTDGRAITFARATGRHFAKIFSFAFFGLGIIITGFTRQKQGAHDMLSGCLVLSYNPTGCGNQTQNAPRGFFHWVGVSVSAAVAIALFFAIAIPVGQRIINGSAKTPDRQTSRVSDPSASDPDQTPDRSANIPSIAERAAAARANRANRTSPGIADSQANQPIPPSPENNNPTSTTQPPNSRPANRIPRTQRPL